MSEIPHTVEELELMSDLAQAMWNAMRKSSPTACKWERAPPEAKGLYGSMAWAVFQRTKELAAEGKIKNLIRLH